MALSTALEKNLGRQASGGKISRLNYRPGETFGEVLVSEIQ